MTSIDPLFFILKTPGFSHFVTEFGYIVILIWFLTFDQLTPIPEEVSLLIVGYLSAHQVFDPILAGACCLAGFLTIDTAYFFLSKKGNSLIKKRIKGSSKFMEAYKNKLRTNTPEAILILCFIPRMRMFAPILAGSMRLWFKKFLLFDSIALIVFTTVYLLVGIIFNKSLEKLISKTKGLQNIVFFWAVFVIAVSIILFVRLKRKERTGN